MPKQDDSSIVDMMMLGSMMQSEEEGKATQPVLLTEMECKALAILSHSRFRQLFDVPGEEASRMCKIYLGITSKLTISLIAHGMGVPSKEGEEMQPEDQGQDQTGQDAPDRAEEKRVDVPQNETAAPVEAAQAGDAAPTQTEQTQVTETRTETHTEPASDAQPTDQ